jgi:hypothetical protein
VWSSEIEVVTANESKEDAVRMRRCAFNRNSHTKPETYLIWQSTNIRTHNFLPLTLHSAAHRCNTALHLLTLCKHALTCNRHTHAQGHCVTCNIMVAEVVATTLVRDARSKRVCWFIALFAENGGACRTYQTKSQYQHPMRPKNVWCLCVCARACTYGRVLECKLDVCACV